MNNVGSMGLVYVFFFKGNVIQRINDTSKRSTPSTEAKSIINKKEIIWSKRILENIKIISTTYFHEGL